MARFLQTTLDEMTLQARGESHSNRAKEFKQFFDNVSFEISKFCCFLNPFFQKKNR